MKYLPILPILFLSISLQAQTADTSGTATTAADANAAASAARPSAQSATSATEAANVSAELTKKLDTRHAQVGDEVLARTTQSATLADGTKLPSGTKLVGKVTEVHARSKADKSAHLAFELDHAVLRHGREVPIHAMLTSVTASSVSAATDDSLAAPAAVGAQGGARASGGGLLGGAGGAVGGVAGGIGHTAGEVGGTVQSGAGSVVHDTRAVGGAIANTGVSGTVDHVPVANLPGVTLSSSANTSSSGSLDASGRNIDLESGTTMTLNVSAGRQ